MRAVRSPSIAAITASTASSPNFFAARRRAAPPSASRVAGGGAGGERGVDWGGVGARGLGRAPVPDAEGGFNQKRTQERGGPVHGNTGGPHELFYPSDEKVRQVFDA